MRPCIVGYFLEASHPSSLASSKSAYLSRLGSSKVKLPVTRNGMHITKGLKLNCRVTTDVTTNVIPWYLGTRVVKIQDVSLRRV